MMWCICSYRDQVVLDGTSAWFLRFDDVSNTDDKAVIMGWGATHAGKHKK